MFLLISIADLCDAGWVFFSGSCFLLVTQRLSYNDALVSLLFSLVKEQVRTS